MGYYLNNGKASGKVEWLVKEHDGKIVDKVEASTAFNDPSLAVVVVMDNGLFDAAGFAYDIDEFESFTSPDDIRPKIFLVMNRELCEKLSGFNS